MVEDAGTPATVVITEPFQALITSGAVKLGAPGFPSLVVPHPVWGKDEAELRDLARTIADRALEQLLDP